MLDIEISHQVLSFNSLFHRERTKSQSGASMFSGQTWSIGRVNPTYFQRCP